MSPRTSALILLPLLGVTAVITAVYRGQLPPADFTFVNETSIESLDPAVVTGQPEGRIIWAVFEGVTRPNPKGGEPLPALATDWDISEDGRTYTFHLRKNAKWSSGDPVTAADIVYGIRRFLDPQTLAEYAYQAWYIKNAKRYSQAARGVDIGDPVEIEMHYRPEGALPFARGKLIRGTLVGIELDDVDEEMAGKPENYTKYRTFIVEHDGTQQAYRVSSEPQQFAEANSCKQLMLDFGEVGIRAVDDYTLETTLNNPTPYWPQLLGFYPLSPVHQECVETHGSPAWTYAENIVTNGPYQIEFRRIRDRIRLKKNPHYWNRDAVSIETIDALAVESLTTALNLYETGQVDWVTKVPPLIAREMLKQDPPRNDFNPAPQFACYFYRFNVTRPPLDDPRVRKALAMAIDREELISTAGSGEPPAYSLVPPGLPDYVSPQCPKRNVKAAQRLLAEAGFPQGNGFPKIEILYNTEEQHQTIAELIRKQWQQVLGINVAIRNEEWGTYQSSQRQMRFDICRSAWIGDYLDPNTFLDMFVTDGENNNTGWSSPQYDGLIAEIQQEVDPEKRLELLEQAEAMLMEELPIVPIYFYVSRNLVRPYVRGFHNTLQDMHPLWALSIDRESEGPNEYMAGEVE